MLQNECLSLSNASFLLNAPSPPGPLKFNKRPWGLLDDLR